MIDLYSNFPINEKQDIWVRACYLLFCSSINPQPSLSGLLVALLWLSDKGNLALNEIERNCAKLKML